MTIKGSAFSVGGSSFTVAGGSAAVAYQLTAGDLQGLDQFVRVPDSLYFPKQSVLDQNGRIYTVDTFNDRVMVFNSNGTVLWTLGSHARVYSDPEAVARTLAPFMEHFRDAGLGTVSEIFEPHTKRGKMACVVDMP